MGAGARSRRRRARGGRALGRRRGRVDARGSARPDADLRPRLRAHRTGAPVRPRLPAEYGGLPVRGPRSAEARPAIHRARSARRAPRARSTLRAPSAREFLRQAEDDPVGQLSPSRRIVFTRWMRSSTRPSRSRRPAWWTGRRRGRRPPATNPALAGAALDEHLVGAELVTSRRRRPPSTCSKSPASRQRHRPEPSSAQLGPSTGRFGLTQSSAASTGPNSTSFTRSSSAISSR